MHSTFVLLTALAVLLNAGLATLVLRRDPESPLNRSYAYLLGLLVLIGFFQTLQNASTDPREAMIWSRLGAAGGSLLPPFLLRLVIELLRLRESRLFARLSDALHVLAALLAGLALGSDLLVTRVQATSWGWQSDYGPLFHVAFTPLVVASLVLFFGLLARDATRKIPRADPSTALFLGLGLGLPAACGLYGDIVSPLSGGIAMGVGVLGSGVGALVVAWGLFRHGILSGSASAATGTVADMLGDALVIARGDLAITYANPAARRLLGRGLAEPQGHLYDLFVDPDDFRNRVQGLPHATNTVFEDRISTLSGAIQVTVTATVLRDRAGRRVRFIVLVRDMRELLGTLDALRESQRALSTEKERLQVTLASIADGVIATDAVGRITLLNPVAERLTGWTSARALGEPVTEVYKVLRSRSGVAQEAPVERALPDGVRLHGDEDLILVDREGVHHEISECSASIQDPEGGSLGVVTVFRDETEQRRQMEELRNVQKLESLGVLAGGIAHDFNNILTAILGNISLMQESLDASHPLQRRLGAAEKALGRARDLTQQLLTFARGGTPIRKPSSIAAVIRESVNFSLTGSKSSVRFDLPHDLWPVEADVGQLGQVVQNLALNGIQAMSEGGILEVSASNVTVGPQSRHRLAVGQYVRLSVRDQGPGIPADILPRIFDPYFTTKPKGSGLGLSVCYSIAKNHGGGIFVELNPGRGTCFFVYVPVASHAPKDGEASIRRTEAGHGSILLMDDEQDILEIGKAILTHLGYDVTTASDGYEAIALFRQAREKGTPFDAVIMDLTVPGSMGGLEATRALLRLDPALRAVVSSGYSEDPVMADPASNGFCAVVSKPYRVEDISLVLHAVLQPR